MLDPEDWDLSWWEAHLDLDPREISERLGGGLSEEEALAYAVAAVRETFEEAGVLLAHVREKPSSDHEISFEVHRNAHGKEGWFRRLVVDEGLTLAISRLARWANWITPIIRPRRFDTRFYLTSMPDGQECRPDAAETVHGIWISPEEALHQNLRGRIPLSPPTLVTLHELLPFKNQVDLDAEAAKRGWGDAQLIKVHLSPRGTVMILPWDPCYDQDTGIDVESLQDLILPVGEPFSRVWCRDGLWIPVGPCEKPHS
jgi:8-oxo-dGTP pyrophosphatase MutT (NUDIX family)